MDYDMDDEDYGLQYSDDDGSEPDVLLENQYYAAKGLKSEGDLRESFDAFNQVLELEKEREKGDWGFKALKQMIKLTLAMGKYDKMLHCYRQLLTYIKSAVTKNYAEKSINSILDHVSTAGSTSIGGTRPATNYDLLQQFYEITLDALKEAKNERLWFKTNTKLGKLYFDLHQYDRLKAILRQLRSSCQTELGEDDQKKGTQLLEIYALEIQMYTELKNNKALQALYEQAIRVKSAIPHPLIMGTIRECGGKMHLRSGEFGKAHTDFFEAFKNYDESGSPRRISCLKYLVLANMLMKSDINPFDSQETKPFRGEPEILVMTQLVQYYQKNDIDQFDRVLRDNNDAIMSDPFIREHVEELVRNIRNAVLLRLLKPYTRIGIGYLADELHVDKKEVIPLLVEVIQDIRPDLRIDQLNETVVRVSGDGNLFDASRCQALNRLASQLEQLKASLAEKVF